MTAEFNVTIYPPDIVIDLLYPSGDINVTDPGFTPQFLWVWGSNNYAAGNYSSPEWDEGLDPQGLWV